MNTQNTQSLGLPQTRQSTLRTKPTLLLNLTLLLASGLVSFLLMPASASAAALQSRQANDTNSSTPKLLDISGEITNGGQLALTGWFKEDYANASTFGVTVTDQDGNSVQVSPDFITFPQVEDLSQGSSSSKQVSLDQLDPGTYYLYLSNSKWQSSFLGITIDDQQNVSITCGNDDYCPNDELANSSLNDDNFVAATDTTNQSGLPR